MLTSKVSSNTHKKHSKEYVHSLIYRSYLCAIVLPNDCSQEIDFVDKAVIKISVEYVANI